jgi:hypothetical protein
MLGLFDFYFICFVIWWAALFPLMADIAGFTWITHKFSGAGLTLGAHGYFSEVMTQGMSSLHKTCTDS